MDFIPNKIKGDRQTGRQQGDFIRLVSLKIMGGNGQENGQTQIDYSHRCKERKRAK
jgi:hypothetical protein